MRGEEEEEGGRREGGKKRFFKIETSKQHEPQSTRQRYPELLWVDNTFESDWFGLQERMSLVTDGGEGWGGGKLTAWIPIRGGVSIIKRFSLWTAKVCKLSHQRRVRTLPHSLQLFGGSLGDFLNRSSWW